MYDEARWLLKMFQKGNGPGKMCKSSASILHNRSAGCSEKRIEIEIGAMGGV
jgi:hypothetical protein